MNENPEQPDGASAGDPADSAPSLSRRETLGMGLSAMAALSLPGFAHAHGGMPAFRGSPLATLMSGEPTANSIVLQARFSRSLPVPADPVGTAPGVSGEACFEILPESHFPRPMQTAWTKVDDSVDFIAKVEVTGLTPGTRYRYRAVFRGADHRGVTLTETGYFRTLRAVSDRTPVSFAVFSCLSYELFYGLGTPSANPGPWREPAQGEARRRGYPDLDLIRNANPDFMVATGDAVYYDHPASNRALWATTPQQMREKWQRQFALPAVRESFAAIPAYFMKDDHDFRFDDADNAMSGLPSPADGAKVFLEQVPLPHGPAAGRPGSNTYRTHRVNRHLQIWLLEGRDHRSPNSTPDSPAKSLWGAEQRQWLQETLLASTADFKVIISPSPIVGPDDDRKSDNHTSVGGFRTEGLSFLSFLKDNGLHRSTFIVNGDRHWKYHSVHPTGVEEFCCGTAHRQNSRYGVAPGDSRGTDPQATIRQPYLQPIPDGGHLQIDVEPDQVGELATLLIRFWSETGDLQYAVRRFGNRPSA